MNRKQQKHDMLLTFMAHATEKKQVKQVKAKPEPVKERFSITEYVTPITRIWHAIPDTFSHMLSWRRG